ncbi:hypothetical protein [Streptomyces natalensis]|uniref:hypothetical protein n=1 Tax=Streptomyces natalensis TaxID=68242 RepID=UPI0012FEE091|nr:hypothetical protein [Streptomyces natalensis]
MPYGRRRELPDQRVRAGVVAVKFRLEQGGQEEGMRGQFGDAPRRTTAATRSLLAALGG